MTKLRADKATGKSRSSLPFDMVSTSIAARRSIFSSLLLDVKPQESPVSDDPFRITSKRRCRDLPTTPFERIDVQAESSSMNFVGLEP